jgi:hypothetical protein
MRTLRFDRWAIAAITLVVWAVAVVILYGWHRSLNLLVPIVISGLWLALFSLACWGAGQFAFHGLIRQPNRQLSDAPVVLALGAGCLAAAAGLLGTLGQLSRISVLLILAVMAAAGGISVYRRLRGVSLEIRWNPYIAVAVAAGLLALLGGSALAVFYDQWNYHLAFPFQWLRAGSLVVFPRHAYSFFPSNMGLVYVYGLAVSGGWAAQLVHLWMGVVATAAAAVVAERFFPSSGAVAAAVFAATPGVIDLGSVAGSELGVAAFFLCGWIALLRAFDDHQRTTTRWLVVAGVLVGLAVGCKYLAILLVAIPIGLVLPMLVGRGSGAGIWVRSTVMAVALVSGTALLVWSPWALRNLVTTGDPVYPYLSSTVGERENQPSAIQGDELAAGIGEFGWSRDRAFFAATAGTFDGRDVGGITGPVYLWLLPLWALSLFRPGVSRPEQALATALGLGFLAAAFIPSIGRYLVPLYAASAAGVGATFLRFTGGLTKPLRTTLHVMLFALLVNNLNPFSIYHLPSQIGVVLGIVGEDGFLDRNVTYYPAIEYINRELPADAVVYFLAESRSFGIERKLVLEDPIIKPLIVEIAEISRSSEDMIVRLRSHGITHILFNRREAERIATLNHRQDYFATGDQDAQTRTQELFGQWLGVVWQNGPLIVFEVPEVSP